MMMTVFSLFGFLLLDVVYISAIVNYAVQSEMLIDLLRSVYVLVETSLLSREDQTTGPTAAPPSLNNKPIDSQLQDRMQVQYTIDTFGS